MTVGDGRMVAVTFIEELPANPWPAEVVQALDSWRLRFNGGATSRANSVWANWAGGRVTPGGATRPGGGLLRPPRHPAVLPCSVRSDLKIRVSQCDGAELAVSLSRD